MVLLERKGVSGWISKCSLVKSDGVPQGTYVHMYVFTYLQYENSRYRLFGTFVCMYTVVPVQCWFPIYNPF